MAISIILVDDHRVVRQGLRALLEREPGLRVVAEADDGRSGVELVSQHGPDVVIVDLSMPGLNGIDAARRMLAASPGTKVLALSAHSERALVEAAFEAGAVGYVVKDAAIEELVEAVRAAAAGERYLSARIDGVRPGAAMGAAAVAGAATGTDARRGASVGAPPARGHVSAAAAAATAEPGVEASAFRRLTPREREVLQLLAEGLATKEVAGALKVSVKTAETHRRAIMEKLDLHSVAELTKYAVREGLTTLG